jgi:Holliday junction resolvase RusA-like endonuclease
MSGKEALEHLADGESDLREPFRLLQLAIRENNVRARARERERDRDFWYRRGLGHPDYEPRVDGQWRNRFILVDPQSVDLNEFSSQSEISRNDLVHSFKKRSKGQGSNAKRLQRQDLDNLIKSYFDSQENPTQKGLEDEAKKAGFSGDRQYIRDEFTRRQNLLGKEVARGRRRKSPET